MVQIIDTFSQIGEVFCNGRFDLKRWREYINTIYRNTSDIFEDDLQEYIESGSYTYEDDILPLLNRVQGHPFLETLHTSFVRVTNGLNPQQDHIPSIDVRYPACCVTKSKIQHNINL